MKKDGVTIARINSAHPAVRAELAQIYERICLTLTGSAQCRFAHVLRSFAEQNALYAQGRTTGGKIVTNARGGQSYHNYGLAVDIVLIVDEKTASWDTAKDFDGDKVADWMEIVKTFKQYGWEWGGDFKSIKDYPHFQKTFNKKESELQTLWATGKKDAQGYVLLT